MKRTQTHVTYGLITAIAVVILGLILYVAKVSFESWAQFLTYAVFLAGILLNAFAYSKANNAYVTFGQVFGSCFKATLIIAVIVTVWTAASMFIFPEMQEQILEKAMSDMSKRGMSDEQVDQAMGMTKKMIIPMGIGGALIGSIGVGAIFSLIGGAVAKKNPLPPQMQENNIL